jgi:hypothetical protein
MRLLTTVLALCMCTAAGCGERAPSASDLVGTYSADLAPESGSPRRITLRLEAGNSADMATEFPGDARTVRETGTWAIAPDGTVRIVLARAGMGPVTNDVTFRFSSGTLSAVAFDTVRWGPHGFSLRRQ